METNDYNDYLLSHEINVPVSKKSIFGSWSIIIIQESLFHMSLTSFKITQNQNF